MTGFLILAFLILVAGVLAVPLATRLGLGSVLGYLLAGMAISPLLAALSVDVEALQVFAEFGVVMMLFIIGLEMEPKRLWEMRGKLAGLGGGQVVLTTLVLTGIALLADQPWQTALAIGMVLALSSTAIIVQTLTEKGLMRTQGGEASFSVLLVQDVAVIPILALVPLLALPELASLAAGAWRGRGAWRDRPHRAYVDLAGRGDSYRGSGSGDRHRHFRDPAAVPLHCARQSARTVHRCCIARGDRDRAADVAGRPLARARCLHCRRGAGDQRVPARARKRHQPVQGTAAGLVLHNRGRGDRFRPRRDDLGFGAVLGRGHHCRENGSAAHRRLALRTAQTGAMAVLPQPSAGGRIRLCPHRLRCRQCGLCASVRCAAPAHRGADHAGDAAAVHPSTTSLSRMPIAQARAGARPMRSRRRTRSSSPVAAAWAGSSTACSTPRVTARR